MRARALARTGLAIAGLVLGAAALAQSPQGGEALPAPGGVPGRAGGGAVASDEDALAVADRAPSDTATASGDLRGFVELAAVDVVQRAGFSSYQGRRASVDVRVDTRLAPGWRLVFADRLDATGVHGEPSSRTVNTLKEAYVAWQPQAGRLLDLGRVNPRQGVATGFNPTDVFKANAIRSQVSPDPASLRENRLGSVMLRGQALWDGGAVTALLSPKLADAPSDASYSLDPGATNRTQRWLVAGSHTLAAGFAPQWLLTGGPGQPVQSGLNLTGLLGDATVAFAEWSGGRGQPLWASAPGPPPAERWFNRLALGATHTTASNLSVTLEYEHNGAAPDRAGWDALRAAPPGLALAYLGQAAALQDLATRHALFVYATWQDAGVRRLDLSGLVRVDLDRHSRTSWLEARYRWDRVDVAVQWLRNAGDPVSAFGGLPVRGSLQVLARAWY
jgi:hypothetical protein